MNGPAGESTDEARPRYLTKTRFKLALQCPTKLFYTGKPEFHNQAIGDKFFEALAEGGLQVGALACALHPDGIEVVDGDHAAQLATTADLLHRSDVTIFEAAFEARGLFVRVDILRKRGAIVELIEVKAKSFDDTQNGNFRNDKGEIRSDMRPYLQDIAYQRHVASLAHPEFEFRSFLMLPDKSTRATVQGVNQRFTVRRVGGRAKVEMTPGTDLDALGAPLLRAIAVDTQVNELLASPLRMEDGTQPYPQAVERLAAAYRDNERIAPKPGAHCAGCEFRTASPPERGLPRSGFHECWSAAFGWTPKDFEGGTVLDLWNHQQKSQLMSRGILKLGDVTQASLSLTDTQPGADGMSTKHRQWYQCSGRWPGDGHQYVHVAGLRAAMAAWQYPLHFIDFETSAVAIPFRRDQRPYQTTAFQFSHHRLHAGGQVEHTTQFLEARPSVDPNLAFLRSLIAALSADDGTVFCWASHENTVLNALRSELIESLSPPEDAGELISFIETLTTRKVGNQRIVGTRCMVDLCKLSSRHYFHPSTHGSSSLKAVLPALMQSSERLRSLYGERVYGGATEMPSLNHLEPVAWWVERDGRVLDPYELLPPVFAGFEGADLGNDEQDVSAELRAGGDAMAAYARLQLDNLDVRERRAIESALLRYCELDTLAMVMAVQAWQAWVADAGH